MCPFRFRVSSFSNTIRVRRSVGSLLCKCFGQDIISAANLPWYLAALRTTLAIPLSTGRTMMEFFFFKVQGSRASCCSFMMLGSVVVKPVEG